MADRRPTPDILGAVLGGEPEEATSKPASQQAGKPAKRQASKPARRGTSKVADKPDSKPAGYRASMTVKATFYLSPKTLDFLEDGLHQLRKMAGQDRTRLTKSALVEEALRTMLRDLEQNGPASQLASKLVRQ